jgi:hypothetical protein
MTARYTLWDIETRNIVASFGAESEALAAVRETLKEDGRELAETLLLGREDDAGRFRLIAAGRALVERAGGATTTGGAGAVWVVVVDEVYRTAAWAVGSGATTAREGRPPAGPLRSSLAQSQREVVRV